MRSIKTHGGMTRGKGMTANQRLVWGPPCPYVQASINDTIHTFSDVSYETGDQHKGTTSSLLYLSERDPFVQNNSQCNIANDMTDS